MKNVGKKALLVGINRYNDSKLSDLKFAGNDVSSIYSVLTDPNRGGFNPDNCLLMTDRSKETHLKPTRSNLMSSISSLSQTAKPDDYVLFFFSGHGIEEGGKSYLLPSDARINVLKHTAVSIDWIRTTLKSSKAHAEVLILDACHAGAMKGKAESGRMTKGMQDALFPPMEGFAILSSCKLNEVSYEMPEKKHGVFSYFLIEGLQGAADFDSDGRIMVSDASRYTAEKTMDWSYKEGVQQTPNLEYKVVGDLVLVDVPLQKEKKVQRRIKKVKQDFFEFTSPISTIELIFPFSGTNGSVERTKLCYSKFCTHLLKHFGLHEITYIGKAYVFPLGELDDIRLRLNYSAQDVKKIDDIFVTVANIMHAQIVAYFSSMPFDLPKITALLKTMNWVPLNYDPRKLHETDKGSWDYFLEVPLNFPEFKQQLIMKFSHRLREKAGKPATTKEDQSLIVVNSKKEATEALGNESMQMLKPTKFLKLIGDIWKH